MSWKLDDIDFNSYGVGVTKVTGLFDMPKLLNEPIDWLDEDGDDYWHDISDLKIGNQKINLYCYITADTYANFISKLNIFYAAVIAPGKRMLLTPYTDAIECYFDSGININHIDRGSRFVNSKQAGIFVLTLTNPGDSTYDFISILDKSSSDVKEVIKTKNLVISKTLQGEEYATCTCETNTPLTSGMYDWIRVNTDGTNLDAFLLPSIPQVRKDSTNKFVYDLRFDGITLHFKQMKFIMFGESEFDFYGDLAEVAALICENVDRFVWFGNNRFTIGSCAATVKKLHNFANEDCLSALQRICQEYGMEFRFERQPDTKYKIYISEFESKENTVELEYGKGNSLYNISQGAMDTSKLCTVLWAYGADKNIKAGYRDGVKRLSFEGNPLHKNEATYGTWEHTENFDEIFPNRTSTVTGVLHVFPDTEIPPELPATIQYLTEAEKEVYPNGIFIVGDTTIDFNLNDYLIGGLTAKIVMKTGDLAGYQFDILRYDHQYQYIHIIRFMDEAIGLLPNATLQIQPGDEYTLVDMDQPTPYVSTAETALEAKAQEYIDKWSVPQYEYNVKTNPAWFAANPGTGFNVGDIVNVYDANLGIDAERRVNTMSFNFNTKIYELSLSTFKKPTKRQQTEFRLQVIERALFANRKEEAETTRDERKTTGTVERRIFDDDGKIRVDNSVRNNSIDPGMISHDLAIPTLVLTGAWLNLNVDGNEDAISVEAGEALLRNWNTKSRFEIQKIRENGGTYNPHRVWTIPAADFTLPTKESYWLYIRLPKAEEITEGSYEISTELIEIKLYSQDGFFVYPINPITAGEE